MRYKFSFYLFICISFSSYASNEDKITQFDGLDWGVSKRYVQSERGDNNSNFEKTSIFYNYSDIKNPALEGIKIESIHYNFDGTCDSFFSKCELTEGYYSLEVIDMDTLMSFVQKIANKHGMFTSENAVNSPFGTGLQYWWVKFDNSYIKLTFYPEPKNIQKILRTYIQYGSHESGAKSLSPKVIGNGREL
jgi:hypothetical protein